jgi:hypothetical protein
MGDHVLLPKLPLGWTPTLVVFAVNYREVTAVSTGKHTRDSADKNIVPRPVINDDVNFGNRGDHLLWTVVDKAMPKLLHKTTFNTIIDNVSTAKGLFQLTINLLWEWLRNGDEEGGLHTLLLDKMEDADGYMTSLRGLCEQLHEQVKEDAYWVTPSVMANYNRFIETLIEQDPTTYQAIELHDVWKFDDIFIPVPRPTADPITDPLPTDYQQADYQRDPRGLIDDDRDKFVLPIISLVHPFWQNPLFLRISATCKILRKPCSIEFIHGCIRLACGEVPNDVDDKMLSDMLKVVIKSRVRYFTCVNSATDAIIDGNDLEGIEAEERLQSARIADLGGEECDPEAPEWQCPVCMVVGHDKTRCPRTRTAGEERDPVLSEASALCMLLDADAKFHTARPTTLHSAWHVLDALAYLELICAYTLESELDSFLTDETALSLCQFDTAPPDAVYNDKRRLKVDQSSMVHLVSRYNQHVKHFWGNNQHPQVTVTGQPCAFVKCPDPLRLKGVGKKTDFINDQDLLHQTCALLDPTPEIMMAMEE